MDAFPRNPRRWFPIEADPDVLTEYLRMATLSDRYVIDIPVVEDVEELGIFDEHKILAYIFLYDPFRQEMILGTPCEDVIGELFYMNQSAVNSCASVALFHAFLNTIEKDKLEGDSLMARFYHNTLEMTAKERGLAFENDTSIYDMHQMAANQGLLNHSINQINYHYVVFVHYDGIIYELDGQKDAPHIHGEATEENFKSEALLAMKNFMENDSDNPNFSIVALCAPKDHQTKDAEMTPSQ